MLQQKDTLGKKGEALVYAYLKNKGYKIIAKNYKNFLGEIDIIAKDKDYLVFIEVKTRMSRAFGDPLEAVNKEKQFKIRQVATMYLKAKRMLDSNCRFDVIAVLGDDFEDIRHIENAF
ncbi:MAG: YraN family protein [Clostridia bacterium]|nr:YraN family protein [Clostridia bacterium]